MLLRLVHALLDRGDEVARDHATDDRVDELVAFAACLRFDAQPGDGELSVVVTDHGTGFVADGRNGVGLTNLRDRVEALGGRLIVDSSPGYGTSVAAHLPIAGGAARG